MINDCLWIWLNCSNYNFTFTIIDFLTIIWLFFAWYQLIRPIHKLRLNYYNFFNLRLFRFVWLAFFCILMPLILKFVPGKAIPILWYDIFRETLSVIIVTITWIILFFQAKKPITKIKNLSRLKQIIIIYLWWNDKEIEALWHEFWYFISDLIKKVDWKNEDAYKILLLCKNKRFITNIIVNNVTSFDKLLKTYYERKLTNESYLENLHKDFIKLIINESLSNDDSILSREIKWEIYEWFNGWKWIISQTIFEDFKFIHDYDLLDREWYNKPYLNYDLPKAYGNNYVRFWNLCIESFFWWTIGEENNYYEDICWGLCKFAWFKWIIYNKIIDWDLGADALFRLQIKLSSKLEKNIMKSKIDSSFYYKIDEWWFHPVNPPKDFIEAVSWWCYMCLESVAEVNETVENTETIRYYCNLLYWMRIKHWGDVMEAIWDNIRNLILWHIKYMNSYWKYPSMTRVFFHIFWTDIFYKYEELWENEMDFLMEILQIISKSLDNFSNLCFRNFEEKDNENLDLDLFENRNKKAQEILDSFLPNYMSYSHKDKTLTYYSLRWIEKSILDLKELENNKIVILNSKKKK